MLRFIVFALFVLFVGCSEKKYFTPSVISGELEVDGKLEDSIMQSNRSGALLKDGTLITKDGIYKVNLKDDFLFLNTSGDLILAANYTNNTLYILNKDGKELHSFAFEYMPITASLKDNVLAVVLSNNTLMLWDTNVNEELFSYKNPVVYAINSKTAAPLFLDTTVVFPSLDGKLVVVDLNNFKIVRNITLGMGNYFNNIIYLAVDNNNLQSLVVATNSKVMTLIDGKNFSYDVNINDILYKNDKIYILSLEGEVIELDLLLNELNKVKFPFATLSTIIISDNIYTLESQGYLIKIDPNSFIDSIYKININEYRDSFYTDSVIYYDDRFIVFPK